MDKLKDSVPFLTVYLLTFGYVRLWAYYKEFNIDIGTYLDLSEIFQLQFLGYAALAVLMIPLILFFVLWAHYQPQIYEESLMGSLAIRTNGIIYYALYFFIAYYSYLCALSFSKSDAKDLLKGEASKEVFLKLEGRQLETNKRLVFVGQTKNYIFFYNRLNKETTVFKVSDAKQIRFRPGIDHSKEAL